MGRVVTFEDLRFREVQSGVHRADLTGGDMKELAAEVIRLAPGAALRESVPPGSDRYLFTLHGGATIAGAGPSLAMVAESFATIQEGTRMTVANATTTASTLIGVVAPPAGSGGARAGFAGGLTVAARATTPVHDVPEQKKGRIYFVGDKAAPSARAHAMIVQYVRDTVTGLHMHPDAESLFVLLSGKIAFTTNGEDVVVARGQAAYFPMGDRHGLRVAEGEGASFLEFHVPAAYTTVRG